MVYGVKPLIIALIRVTTVGASDVSWACMVTGILELALTKTEAYKMQISTR